MPTRTLDPTCRLTVGSPPSYIVQFATCKENDFVVAYSDEAGNKFASVRPVDTTKPKIPVIERITWTFTGHIQQPLKIRYDDTLPYGDVPRDMLFCRLDRATGPSSGSTASPTRTPKGSPTSCPRARRPA